jgi:hypothetical protein
MTLLSGCAYKPSSDEGVKHPGRSTLASDDAEYEAITRRIITRVVALKSIYPVLEGISEPQVLDGGLANLEFEHGVAWTLEDPAEPASKLNARHENYDKNGFWIRLHFYRGTWQGAAVFIPVEFGDLKLWFSYGHRPGDDPAIIVAISRIIEEEKKAFDAAR